MRARVGRDGGRADAGGAHSVEVKNWNGARNFVGPVINYLTFNNGYHTIHHMYPTMHWSRLPGTIPLFLPSPRALLGAGRGRRVGGEGGEAEWTGSGRECRAHVKCAET